MERITNSTRLTNMEKDQALIKQRVEYTIEYVGRVDVNVNSLHKKFDIIKEDIAKNYATKSYVDTRFDKQTESTLREENKKISWVQWIPTLIMGIIAVIIFIRS